MIVPTIGINISKNNKPIPQVILYKIYTFQIGIIAFQRCKRLAERYRCFTLLQTYKVLKPISEIFARCSFSSVYFIPSTPSAPLFRTTCRYALLRLSLDSICFIRLLVSMRSFLSVPLDLTTLSPIGYGRCCHFCNTRHTQTYWLFAPLLHLHYRDFFTTIGSADFSQFVVTRLMKPLWDLHA